MPFDAPFKLGPFEVDAAGRLSPFEPQGSADFVFRWHDRLVRASLTQADLASWRLTMQVVLGRVPSTANTTDETQRPRSFALLHWLGHSVPPGWKLCLLADHRIWLEAATCIDLPVTAAALVTSVTCFTLDLEPYLDLLDETGISG